MRIFLALLVLYSCSTQKYPQKKEVLCISSLPEDAQDIKWITDQKKLKDCQKISVVSVKYCAGDYDSAFNYHLNGLKTLSYQAGGDTIYTRSNLAPNKNGVVEGVIFDCQKKLPPELNPGANEKE